MSTDPTSNDPSAGNAPCAEEDPKATAESPDAPPSAARAHIVKCFDEDLPTLRKNPLLGRLGAEDLGAFATYLDEIACGGDSVLVREGDAGEHMYFVLQGTAELGRGDLTLRPLAPGDHFGELSLLGGKMRAASARATSPVRLARLSRGAYERLESERPSLAAQLLRALVVSLGEKLIAMTDDVGRLLRERSVPRRTEITVRRGGKEEEVRTGTLLRALLPAEVEGALVVAGMIDAKPVSLDTPLLSDAAIEPLTLASAEGRIVYRRSAALALLEAASRVTATDDGASGPQGGPGPHAPVALRVGASLGAAQVVAVEPRERAPHILRDVAAALRALCASDAAFREELWTVEEARAELTRAGWRDAALLLRTRRSATVSLQSCGTTYALSLGPLLPSAGLLKDLRLELHPEGLLLDFGEPIRRHMPRSRRHEEIDAVALEHLTPRFGGEMVTEHRSFLRTLGVTGVGAFNDICIAGQVAQVIRVSEGFQEKRIGRLADRIAAQRGTVRIVAVAGPSSSGKTTFIKRLKVQLEINGVKPVGLSLDDYYRDRADTPLDDDGLPDYEAFDALDVPVLADHLRRLLEGETVRTSHFNFVSGKREPEGGPLLKLGPGEVLMLEGIHGLNPLLMGELPREVGFRIFVHPATTLAFDRVSTVSPADLRLLRRIVRDRHSRGTNAAETILRWPSVRRGERVHIYPCLPNADAVFDTSLIYEPSVLKVFADRYLLEVPEGHAAYPTAFRLRNVIDRFVTIYPDHVPPTSILREFIGGSGFEY